MKTKNVFLSLFILLFSLSCEKSEKSVDVVIPKKSYGIVNARTGLMLRSEPSVNGNKITHMPIGASVIIIDKEGPKSTIGMATGNWYKIIFENNEGWAFGPFIKELKDELVSAYISDKAEFCVFYYLKNNSFEMQVNACEGFAFIEGECTLKNNIFECRVLKIKGFGFSGDKIAKFKFVIIDKKTIRYDGENIGCAPSQGDQLIKI